MKTAHHVFLICCLFLLSFTGSCDALGQINSSGIELTETEIPSPADSLSASQTAYTVSAEGVPASARFVNQQLSAFGSVHSFPDGTLAYRGLGAFNGITSGVSVDGQRLASTGFENRKVNFGQMPTMLFSSFSFANINQPETASGSPVLATLSTDGYLSEHRSLLFSAGGGLQTQNREFHTPDNRFSLIYSDSYGDHVRFAAGIYQQGFSFGGSALQTTFANTDFGNGAVDVIDTITPSAYFNEEMNRGAFLNVRIQPQEDISYAINGFVNRQNTGISAHSNFYNTNADWINPQETGAMGNRGQLQYRVGSAENIITQTALSGSGTYLLGASELKLSGGWSFGGFTSSDLNIPFGTGSLNFNINESKPGFVNMEVTNRSLRMQDMLIQEMREVTTVQNEHLINFGLDFDHNINENSRLGAGFLFTNISKKGSFKDASLRLLAPTTAANFRRVNGTELSPFGDTAYQFPFLVEPDDARRFFRNNYSLFRQELRDQTRRSDFRNYELMEQVYASYVLAQSNIGPATLRGGVRLEYTDGSYTGNQVGFNEIGNHTGTIDTTAASSHIHVLPFVNADIQILDALQFSASLSSAVNRQNYRLLSPYRLVNEESRQIFQGDASLSPIQTYTGDARLGWSGLPGGDIYLGGFYTLLQNLPIDVRLEQQVPDAEPLEVFTVGTNPDDSSVYGLEGGWEQQLHFLPGILSHTGFSAHYTRMYSRHRHTLGSPKGDLPGVPDEVISGALFYNSSRLQFATRLSHTSSYTLGYFSPESSLNRLEASEPAPIKSTGQTSLSLSASVTISASLRIWADASNLIQADITEYSVSPRDYAWQQQQLQQTVVMAGFQLTF
ncbi:MAG: outer membrane beta-barrel protein [Balneolales bacterium]|nr:outer membrane beta-barrel protein [Balneolales bacterium]